MADLVSQAGEPVGQPVLPVPGTRILLQHADLIAAQLEQARADLAAWEGERRGAVTIGAFSSAITGLVPSTLRRLAEHHQDVRIAVVEAEPPDLFTRLDGGEIDLAVAVDFAAAPPHTDRRYTRIDLLTDILDLALPATHRHANSERVPLRDLAADTWIVGDPRSCCGAVTRSLCAANGFTPDIGHAVDDWHSLVALVEAGAGVALVPRLVQPLHRPGLVLRSPAGPPPTRHVFAAVRAGSSGDPALAAVLDHLRAAGADAAAPDGPSAPQDADAVAVS
jgi:DNA-binding transcriptional LysR family regulator